MAFPTAALIAELQTTLTLINQNIIANGQGKITGPILNTDLADLIGNIKDVVTQTGANIGGGGSGNLLLVAPPTGVDDTTNITTQITAAAAILDSARVTLAPNNGSDYLTTGITLGNYTKMQGYTVLQLNSGNGPIISVPSQNSLQTAQSSSIDDLILLGNDGVSIGLQANNSAVLIENRINATHCGTGFLHNKAQFCSSYDCKAFSCGVGLLDTADAIDGGGNSWLYENFCAASCSVGVIINGATAFPLGPVYFKNTKLVGNSVCNLAVIGTSSQYAYVYVDGGANEHLGTTASYTYAAPNGSLVIPNCSIYLSFAQVVLRDQFMAEASVSPCIIAQDKTQLVIDGMQGYGNPLGQLVTCDATSSVVLKGGFAVNGSIEAISSFDGSILQSTGNICWMLPPQTIATVINNSCTAPPAGSLNDAVGTASSTTGTDAVYGAYQSITYSASVGNQNTNRANFIVTGNAGVTCVAFNMKSSVRAKFGFRGLNNVGNFIMTLPAGVWVRIFFLVNGWGTGSQFLAIYEADALGATAEFCQFQNIAGTMGLTLIDQINAVAHGAYNSSTL